MIETRMLTRCYGTFAAVDQLTFTVEPGQVLGLLGPNGAGKSTAIRMIAGFLAPTSGQALICGHDVQKEPLAAHRVLGYLPEGAPMYDDLTVHEFLRFIGRARGLKSDALWDGLDEVAEKLDLVNVLGQLIGTLSKGYRRRVGLAQAIIHDPEVLMLDEPTDGLDPNQKHQVRSLIDNLARERTILISTHLLDEVEALCNRVVILANGRLLADSTPSQLLTRSRYCGAVSFSAPGAGLAKRMLERLPETDSVEVDAGTGRITVLPKPGKQLLQPVQQVLEEQQLEVYELQLEAGRLDDVFRTITTAGIAA